MWALSGKILALGMLTGLVGLGGFARDASAGATVDLLFVGLNSNPIAATNTVTVGSGDVLTMAVRMSNDQTLISAFFSLNYDLDGDDELDVQSATQWGGVVINEAGSDFFAPLTELSPITATFVGPFQGLSTNLALPRPLPSPGSYQMGTVTWRVNAGVNDDGVDILSFVNPGVDGFLDGFGNLIDGQGGSSNLIALHSATVNFIPEPGTASLLGLGLVGLVLMGRRSRS